MKIAVDASSLMINPFSGLSLVVHNLLLQLPTIDCSKRFVLYLNYFRKHQTKKNFSYPGAGHRNFIFPRRLTEYWWRLGWPPVDFYLPDVDVFHSLHIQVPPSKKIKMVLTVHDCRYLSMPELYDLREVEKYRKDMEIFLNRADMVAAVSEFTRQEIINHFLFPEDRIRVIHNGFNSLQWVKNDEQSVESVVGSHQFPKNYLLYSGVLDPRKNLDRLIDALALCRQTASDFPDLVITGISSMEWNNSNCARKAKKIGMFNHIHICGVVEQDVMDRLMRHAHALCYPSLYEGFGFPPLEAMSFGVPVLAGRGSSISEVSGPAACLVDPTSVEDMACGVRRIVFDDDYRRDLIQRGYRQIKKFSWKKAAFEYLRLYDEVMDG